MAEAARNLNPSTNTGGSFSSTTPANDNAQAWNRTQMRDALQLRSNQLSDRLLDQRATDEYNPELGETGGGDFVSDTSLPTDSSLGSDEQPLLQLKPQSYMQGPEMAEEAQEIERQRAMLEAQHRFTEPGTAMPESGQSIPASASTKRSRRPEPAAEGVPESETKRALALRQSMGKDRQQAQEKQGGITGQLTKLSQVERALEDVRKVRKVYASLLKAIEAVSSETVLPLIVLIAAVHLETLNILLLHIDVPEPLGTSLALIGINLSYDKNKGMGAYELIIVSITLLFDLVIFLILLPNIVLTIIQIILIVGVLGNIIPGIL